MENVKIDMLCFKIGQLCVNKMISQADPLRWEEEAPFAFGTLTVMTCLSCFNAQDSGFKLHIGRMGQRPKLQLCKRVSRWKHLHLWCLGAFRRDGRKEEKCSFKCGENQNLFAVETGREWRICWTEMLLHSSHLLSHFVIFCSYSLIVEYEGNKEPCLQVEQRAQLDGRAAYCGGDFLCDLVRFRSGQHERTSKLPKQHRKHAEQLPKKSKNA